jgi:hypothetical protein
VRSLWSDFDKRGVAPKKWSNALRSLQDEYVRDMEIRWEVLRFCEDHWKVHQLATSNYPQWYKTHISSKPGDDDTKGPAKKKWKVDRDNTQTTGGGRDTDHESDTDHDASDWDAESNCRSPSVLDEGIHLETTTAPSRPKARIIRDPLYVLKRFTDLLTFLDPLSRANVFDQSGKTFHLQDDAANVVPSGRPVDHNQHDNTNDAMDIDYNIGDEGEAHGSNPQTYASPITSLLTPCIPPVSNEATWPTPMQGPGVTPVSYAQTLPAQLPNATMPHISVVPMQGPGIVPVSYAQTLPAQLPNANMPHISVAPMQGPGITPVSYAQTSPAQLPNANMPHVSVAPMQGPGIAPVSYAQALPAQLPNSATPHVSITPVQGPGIVPVSYAQTSPTQLPNATMPHISVTPMQGTGVPPTTTSSSATPSPGPSIPSTTEAVHTGSTMPLLDANDPKMPTTWARATRIKELQAKRSTNPEKMMPQPSLSAM